MKPIQYGIGGKKVNFGEHNLVITDFMLYNKKMKI